MQNEWLKVISMLVAIETKDSLRRGAIMVVTKKIGLACVEQKAHMSWASLILQNFLCKNQLWKKGYVLPTIFFSKVWWEVTT